MSECDCPEMEQYVQQDTFEKTLQECKEAMEAIQYQIDMLSELHKGNAEKVNAELKKVQKAAVQNENMFEYLMEASKCCSLGQITDALFEVGGQYRRNM